MKILLLDGDELIVNLSIEDFFKSINNGFIKIKGKKIYKSNNYYRDEEEYEDYNNWVNINQIKTFSEH